MRDGVDGFGQIQHCFLFFIAISYIIYIKVGGGGTYRGEMCDYQDFPAV